MSKTSTLEFGALLRATKSCLLAQLQSTPVAPESGVGDPGTGVRTPVAEILNMNIAGTDVTARNLPSGVTLALAKAAPAPLEKGEPATWLSAPFAATLNTLIVIDAPFAAIRNLSSGVAVKDIPAAAPATPPVAKGEPGTEVRTPVTGLIEKALTQADTGSGPLSGHES